MKMPLTSHLWDWLARTGWVVVALCLALRAARLWQVQIGGLS